MDPLASIQMLFYGKHFKNMLVDFPLLHLHVSDVLTSQTDTQLSEVPGQTEGDRIFLVGMSI